MPGPVQVRLLGPPVLVVDGVEIEVPGRLRQAVLALLALEPGQVGSAGLIDALWGEQPPASAANSLQSHVSRLRAHLGRHADLLLREGAGYRLAVGDEAVDGRRVRALAERARTAADPVPLLERALAAWRGPALAEFGDVAPLAAEAARFAELRLTLLDRLLDARLRAGAAPVDEAAAAAAAEPWRESTQLLLMRALARAGRAADALRVGQEYRSRLVAETGLEPTPAVAELAGRIAAGELPCPAGGGRDVAGGGSRVRLPRAPTPLLGREADIARLLPVLDEARCVTLVGPGGVGKTRLALELAGRDAAREVVLVELAPVSGSGVAAYVLAQALGVRGGSDVTVAVLEHLSSRPLLLVLDNCEHLVDEARELCATVLRWTPATVLATSRRPLGVPGEWVHRLDPLAPEPAARIFFDRARRATGGAGLPDGSRAEVEELCRRLDGLPLAIELTAAWLPTVGLTGLRERSDLRLAAGPAGDGGGRQATLRSTIGWSYELLDEPARRLFRRLSVVPDGFDLDVVPDAPHLLPTLVDHSLLVAVPDADGMRYRVLEGIRAFGRELLDSAGETAEALDGLVDWALRFVERARTGLRTGAEPAWHRRVVAAIPGLRAAREEMHRRGDLVAQVRLSVALDEFCLWREQSELWSWALRTAEQPGLEEVPGAAAALAAAGRAAWRLGRLGVARELVERAAPLLADDVDRALCQEVEATVALFSSRHDEALRLFLDAAAGVPDAFTRAAALATAALAAGYGGRDAGELLTEADRLATAAGSPTVRAYIAYVRGEVAALSDPETAVEPLRTAIDLASSAGATFVSGVATVTLASCAARTGRPDTARAAYRDALRYWQRTGSWFQQWTTLRGAAEFLAATGDPDLAALLVAAADADPDAAALDPDAEERLAALRRPGTPVLPRTGLLTRVLGALS